MSKPKIGIIIGSTRARPFRRSSPPNGFARSPRRAATSRSKSLDLRDYPLPFFDEAGVARPTRRPERGRAELAEEGRRLRRLRLRSPPNTIAARPRVLKNALDYAYNEWNKKPVAFVGYGGVGGARAIEQLRLHAVELQMAPTRAGVHILWADMACGQSEGKKLEEFDHLNKAASDMLDQLVWWTKALKTARAADAQAADIKAA